MRAFGSSQAPNRTVHFQQIFIWRQNPLPNEKVVLGTIDNILDESTEKRVGVPAIIVIGEVVAKHRSFQHIKEKALAL